jgi:hypothetical protein
VRQETNESSEGVGEINLPDNTSLRRERRTTNHHRSLTVIAFHIYLNSGDYGGVGQVC